MVRVVDHDPAWAAAFLDAAARIAAALDIDAGRIHHVGSTAVPWTTAKPIIDMLLEAESLEFLDDRTVRLEALGWQAMGEFGIPGRRYFRMHDADGNRTHHLHAFVRGAPDVWRHLAFRDYLCAHPAIAAEYGALKSGLAQAHPGDIDAYMDGKDAFVREHERRALAWSMAHGDAAGS